METPIKFPSLTPLKKMLTVKSFDQLLKDGDIFDVHGASQRSGYTTYHIRRLCREKRIDHFTRGLPSAPDEVQFFFLPEHLDGLFEHQKAVHRNRA